MLHSALTLLEDDAKSVCFTFTHLILSRSFSDSPLAIVKSRLRLQTSAAS